MTVLQLRPHQRDMIEALKGNADFPSPRGKSALPVVSYAEASYFDGYHFQHIAARDEHCRLQRIERAARGRRS